MAFPGDSSRPIRMHLMGEPEQLLLEVSDRARRIILAVQAMATCTGELERSGDADRPIASSRSAS